MRSFFYSQFFVTPPLPTRDFTGKTVLVTGSNVGLGKEAARHFTRLNASTVILAVRSLEKGEAAKTDMENTSGRKGVLRVMQLDMSSYDSVLSFADTIGQTVDRLDVAVLNAGVNRGVWEVFEQDESTITVNVVSTFLLAFALLPKLRETARKFNTRPTLTVVSSEVHQWAKFEERKAPPGGIFARLNEKVAMTERYQVSKLLEVLFVRAWCGKAGVKELPVTVNLVNPGFCHSEFGREGGFVEAFARLLLARKTEVGSRTLVHAASQGSESHGAYLSDSSIVDPSVYVRSEEGAKDAERVWEELVGKLDGIRKDITKQ
ncbi:short-chain dehydrogenase/reductase-like protein [Plenodomus tracheiphilus IPT5]|uniref:Short-chain dehydrogenase/reductase-like protein n=1 Tax=Plenodomus tracheiphilus IPT5 TaxID=1408161 RepID=A0A6A7AX47_9PLEO|nr:short-chain dehydrogenase/reductase-like protein [Plenodomus tracheiphilus IPT5]